MGRPATGSVVEDERGGATLYALRFRADGKRQYVALGSAAQGWTRQKAEEELAYVLAQVKRGEWRRAQPAPPVGSKEEPSFHEFASEWFERKRHEIDGNTRLDYFWQLTHHLLPFFKDHRLSAITRQEVDRYRHEQVRRTERAEVAVAAGRSDRRGLSNTSINKTSARLAKILDDAVEYGCWTATRRAADDATSRKPNRTARSSSPTKSRPCSTQPASSTARRAATAGSAAARCSPR